MPDERSTRPYLIRALYEWALDCGFTPQIAVQADMPGVRVPEGSVHNEQVVLNLSPQAVHQLELGNDTITFFARFSGRNEAVVIPVRAVLAVYARENGRGIQFPAEEEGGPPAAPEPDDAAKKGAHLKIVK